MFEPTVLNYLTEKLENVPVLMELPEVPSADYPEFPYPLVVIQNVGHTRDDFIDRVSLAFQSYGSTLYNAAALDEAVRNAIDQIIELSEVSGVYLTSNYEFSDTRTKRYRYQCVYDFYF